jgi:mannose-6-phosphate isomerase-like protein (cupin superfamily)
MLVGPIADQRYFDTEVAPQLQAPQVTYAGEVTTAACHKLLAEAYALLVPKRNDDTCSLSVLEAMATGTPVVTFATGAMPELVCDGTTGYVVADVNEAVARLAQVDRLRRQDCRQWVQERFSLTRMVERYVALYEQVLAQEKSRAHHATPPWGHWEVLLDEPAYKVKRITVRSDKRLSYQKHFRREEHWTIVQGQALVTLDGQQMLLDAGRTIAIPRQAAHRIANPGPQDLVFIEVQCGTYFGEDDIIRLEDDYGRAGTV